MGPPVQASQPVNIFFLYSPEDRNWYDRLIRHLLPLANQGVVAFSGEDSLVGGADREAEIPRMLAQAHIVAVLTSSDLFADDMRMPWLDQAMKTGHPVVPILVRPVVQASNPLDRLQPLPNDGRALSSLSGGAVDDALVNITKALAELARTPTSRRCMRPGIARSRRTDGMPTRCWMHCGPGRIDRRIGAAS